MTLSAIGRCAKALAILLASAIASLESGAASENGAQKEIGWGDAVDGQAISIATEKDVYEASERIVLTLRIKNVGEAEVPIRYPVPFEYDLRVLLVDSPHAKAIDRRNAPVVPLKGAVPRTLYGVLQLERLGSTTGASAALKPGDHRAVQIDVNRLFDMSVAGKYTISAQRHVWKSRTSLPSKATSNTLEIAIKDRSFFERVTHKGAEEIRP